MIRLTTPFKEINSAWQRKDNFLLYFSLLYLPNMDDKWTLLKNVLTLLNVTRYRLFKS